MKIKRNRIVQQAANTVLNHLSNKQRGDTFTSLELADWSGIAHKSENWNLLIRHVKRRLLRSRSIVIWFLIEVGHWKLLTAEEQVTLVASKRTRKASRQLRRAMVEIRAAPEQELPLHLRASKMGQLARLRAKKSQLNADARIAERLNQPTKTRVTP